MHKHTRWLLAEIDRWVAEGIVTADQAGRLRARYTPAEAGPPWGLIVFATAGAMVIGLGVILIFAYNWDAIPKFGKLALVFGAIIAAHAGAVRLLAGDGWKPRLGEAIAALGTMLYGAGIWLVAQVYHIDEHYPNGFLFWALGALAMAWAIRSTANGFLAVALLVLWASVEVFDFHSAQYAPIILIAAGLIPLAWKQRSAPLLAATIASIQFLTIANVGSWGGPGHAFLSSLALAVLLVAAGRWMAGPRIEFPGGAGVLNKVHIDLTDERWWIVDTRKPDSVPFPMQHIEDPWSASFRIEYAPPGSAALDGLPGADLVRHTTLRSRAFNAARGID